MLKIIVVGVAFLTASNCFADLITFDDIAVPAGFNSYVPVLNGYHSLNWGNFLAFYGQGSPHSGYAVGAVSSPNDAFNGSGTPAFFSSATPFSFTSAYFTAAWNDGLTITVNAFVGSSPTVVDTTTFVVSAISPTLVTFNWSGITEVSFSASGGIEDPSYVNYGGPGTQFAIDNISLNLTPEPSAVPLLSIGLGGLAVLALRRRRWRS